MILNLLFLLKLISNGLDTSILLITNAFPSGLSVEKKNNSRDRCAKKIYKNFIIIIIKIMETETNTSNNISTKKIILEGQLDQPKTDILIIAPWFKEFHTYNHALHPAEHEKLADILIQLIQDLRRINLNIEYRPYKLKVDRVSQSIKYRFGRIQNIHDQILHSRTIICTTITTHLAECILLNKYPLLIITDRAFNTFTDPVKEILNYLHAENFLFRSSNEIFDSEIFSNCEDFLNRINNPSDKIKNAFHNLIGYNLGSKNEFNRILKSFLKNSYKE